MIVVVSDLHAGSVAGLLPPGITIDGGNEVKLNRRQLYLNACWKDFIKRARAGCGKQKPHLVINGDMVQGLHPDKDGELALPSDLSQEQAAVMLLEPLIEALDPRDIWVIKGTEFHDAVGGRSAEQVAVTLGARKDEDTGKRSFWQLWLRDDGKLYQFTHHASTAKGNPATPMQHELSEALSNHDHQGFPLADMQVRSHVHRFRVVPTYDGDRWIMTTPAWQLQTAFGFKKDPNWLPQIGGVLLWVDGDNVRWNPIRYPFPKPRIYQ